MLEDPGSDPYVKLMVLALLPKPERKQGSVDGNQINDIIVLSKENTIRL